MPHASDGGCRKSGTEPPALTKTLTAASFRDRRHRCESQRFHRGLQRDSYMSNAPKVDAGNSSRTDLEGCQRRIGYRFRDLQKLDEALTHASGAEHRLVSNERLEFLGDAILGAVVCEILFHQYPDYLEGDLTKIKQIQNGQFVVVSPAEFAAPGATPQL